MTSQKTYVQIVAVLFVACLAAGCSIFDLKDPDMPEDGGFPNDQLCIGDILRYAGATASYMSYRDYFTDDVVFESIFVMSSIHGCDNVVDMLDRLRPQASHVDWRVDAATVRQEGGKWIMNDVPYTVYFGGNPIGSGHADFEIVGNKINIWRDKPDGLPFFER